MHNKITVIVIMAKSKRSEHNHDDEYNLTYYEENVMKMVEKQDKQLSDVKRMLSANITVMKCALFTIICMVIIIICLLSVIILKVDTFTSPTMFSAPSNDLNVGLGPCKLSMNGQLDQSLMLTKTNVTHKINVVGSPKCHLTFLAVGGGGNENDGNGGAGSGYIQYHSVIVDSGATIIANVGDERRSSTLIIIRTIHHHDIIFGSFTT